jgi:chemotaxis protein histidine kinase CheA
MGIMDKKDIQDAFFKEARSLVIKIEKELDWIDNSSRPAIQDSRMFRLFRYAHTLKGISAMCGSFIIEEAAESMAEIFRTVKDGKHEIRFEEKILIRKNLDVCENFLKGKPSCKS